jgi:hypothetical protein
MSTLGDDLIDVEVTQPQIEQFIKRSLRFYNNYRPAIKGNQFTASENVNKYVLDDIGAGLPWGRGVINVQPQLHDQEAGGEPDIFSGAFWFFYTMGTAYGNWREPADILARQVDLENRRLITGTALDWDFKIELQPDNSEKGVIWFYPSFRGGTTVAYWYADDHILETIPAGDRGWFEDHVLAQTKITLGRVRSKWAGELQMDGRDLLTEGRDEKKTLEAELKKKIGWATMPRQPGV